jgi:hypothetical protein
VFNIGQRLDALEKQSYWKYPSINHHPLPAGQMVVYPLTEKISHSSTL